MFCILIASAHNFCNSFAETVEDLIELLLSECNLDSEWFIENKVFVNPDKFQAILLDKQKSDCIGTELIVCSEENQVVFLS